MLKLHSRTKRQFANSKLHLEPLEDRRLLAVFSVTNLNDAGDGSLRDAPSQSLATPDGDEINFAIGLSGTLTLTSDSLHVEQDMVIDGGDASRITIDANGFRGGPFEVQSGFIDVDFNNDGAADITDLDALIHNIALGPAEPLVFDLTGDGSVDLEDRDQWLVDAGALNLLGGIPYVLADANLDGVKDGLDFIIWNENRFTETGMWSLGDFNADAVTDAVDFIIWLRTPFFPEPIVSPRQPAQTTTAIELENQEPSSLPLETLERYALQPMATHQSRLASQIEPISHLVSDSLRESDQV